MKNRIFVVSVLALCAAALTSCQEKSNQEKKPTPVEAVGIPTSELRLAVVNMDVLNDGFQMKVDVQRELEEQQQFFADDLQRQAAQLQSDFDRYVNVEGVTLTLADQKKKEESFKKRQENLELLNQQYAEQLAQMQLKRMNDMYQFVVNYVEKYNEETGHYTMVLKSGSTGGVLYAVSAADITDAILEGMNAEYNSIKAAAKGSTKSGKKK